MGRKYSSRSVATSLASGITQGAGQMVVGSTSGFPTSYPYTLIVDSGGDGEEVVTVTAAVGTTLTVTRGEDGTQAVAHIAGVKVVHGVSARDFADTVAHIEGTANVHGITSTADLSRKSAVEWYSGQKTFEQPVILLGIPSLDMHAASIGDVVERVAAFGGEVETRITARMEGTTKPADLGTAAVGTATTSSRSDHVHKRPTPADIGAVATNLIHAGRTNITLTAAAAGTSIVTWPAMPGTLSVVATVYGTVAYIATVETLTSTGCTIRVQHINATAATVTLSIHYIVVSADA
jgi:hypothetical protein